MTIVLRADATPEVGLGHVMRSSALALRMRKHGHNIVLMTSELPPTVHSWLRDKCIEVITMPSSSSFADASQVSSVTQGLCRDDWLVVDHYGLDHRWECGVDRGEARLCVIDDLANRRHECDVLIDVGMHADHGDPYRSLVPSSTEVLGGPGYALLRPEFDAAVPRERTGEVGNILVSLGGGNQVERELSKILTAIAREGRPDLHVVVLADAASLRVVNALARAMPSVTLMEFAHDMPERLNWADVVIGTCGGASWERCLLGVPAIVCLTSENQRRDYELLAESMAVFPVGETNVTTVEDWGNAIKALLSDSKAVTKMGMAASSIMSDRARSLERLDEIFGSRD